MGENNPFITSCFGEVLVRLVFFGGGGCLFVCLFVCLFYGGGGGGGGVGVVFVFASPHLHFPATEVPASTLTMTHGPMQVSCFILI